MSNSSEGFLSNIVSLSTNKVYYKLNFSFYSCRYMISLSKEVYGDLLSKRIGIHTGNFKQECL